MKKMRWLILTGLLSVCLFLSNASIPADQRPSDSPDRWQTVERWVGNIRYEYLGGPNEPIGGLPGTSRQIIAYDFVLEREDDRTWRGRADGQGSYEAQAEQRTDKGVHTISVSGQGALQDMAFLRMNYRQGHYTIGITGRPGPITAQYRQLWVVQGQTLVDIDKPIETTLGRVSSQAPFSETPMLPEKGFVLSGTLEFSFHWESHKLTWSLQPAGSITVDVRGPEETIEGLNSDPFTAVVTPHVTNVESYTWEANWPEGSGHRPEVNFENPNAASTRVLKASWFSFPDSRWAAQTGIRCVYEIVAIVRINGAEYRSDPYPWTVRVDPTGEAKPDPPWGEEWTIQIEVSVDDGLWYVTGPGNFQRYGLWAHVNAPESSDFYDKVEAHEEHHVRQHQDIEPWASMWDVGTFFQTVLLNLPGQPSRRDMFWLAMDEVDAWDARQTQIFFEHQCRMEWEAFQVEYGVEPRYLEWRKQDVEASYGCRF